MKQNAIHLLLLLGVALQAPSLTAREDRPGLVVHEWGTFTSLQDESGRAVGGINTDDEPVPKFVHRLADHLLLSPTEVPGTIFQGAPHCHPDVTMRLETPVIYFHPSSEQPRLRDLSVTATFRGGWLSEFYPDAEAEAPGLRGNTMVFGPLTSSSVSSLAWKNLQVGGDWSGPATTQHVWTSPRAVKSAPVRTSAGESENFLFYRGVAHIDAPITITQDSKTSGLVLRSQYPPEMPGDGLLKVDHLWLVDVAVGGSVAFRTLPAVTLERGEKTLARVSSRFSRKDHSVANLAKLKASLKEALAAGGLFDEEAQALLNTWELSYFKSAGLRIFFMVPRAWTDHYLPLKLSTPAALTRVMVGRIELVTPAQRKSLRNLAELSPEVISADAARLRSGIYDRIIKHPDDVKDLYMGRQSLEAGGVSVPDSYQMYLSLGRFRNALILDEARERPTAGLDKFISDYGLEGYKPAEPSPQASAARQ